MSELIKHLANYLKQELITSINTSPNDSLRVIFSAPPEQQLAGLFEYLIGNDECLILDTDQGKLQVPVYLVQQRAQDPTEKLMAARCTPSFLVTIRNYDDFPIWVALQEVGAASNASLSTAVKPLGIAKELAFDLWLDTPVISYLVEEVKATIGLDESDEASNSALRYALQEAWNADIRYKDKRTVWQLLQKLLDTALVGKPPYVILSAILGFPYASPKEFGKDQHLKLVSRISAFFQSHGLRAGFAELQTKAHGKDDLLSYLSAMQAHISAQNIIDAGDFEKHPLNAYCPIEPTSLLIPEWWSGLGLQEWLDLLGSGGEEEDAPETDKLEVKISNLLVVVPKGLQPLVRDHAELEISVKDLDSPVEVVIERSVGNQKLIRIHTDEIEPNKAITFVDIEDVPEHKNFIRYKVTVEGHEPIVIKLIILDSYDPGIIAFSSGASKASVFSLNNKARDKHNKKITRYESDLKLSGMGSHYLNLFVSKHMKLDDIIWGYEIDVEHTDPIKCNVTRIDENHYSCLIEVDEECHYEINAVVPSTQAKSSFRVYITAEESKQSGATSEFDRLVMMHRSSAAGKHSSPRVDPLNCRVMDLEMWILESEHSYRPLILGPDFIEAWKKPEWEENTKLSHKSLPVDPRPPVNKFTAPERFLSVRKKLLNLLAKPKDELTPPASSIELYKYMQKEGFVETLKEFLDAYFEWLSSDYSNAIWSDVISVHAEQANGKTLDSTPYAILLSPFHPIRLAWQCCAQDILQRALDKHSRCPAASVMNPTSFPDCLILPCRTATGSIERKPFIAMANSSDYWSVLLSVTSTNMQGSSGNNTIFGDALGISVDGLASGFSAQQVVRSFDEVSRLMSAKSTLRIGVSSDTGGSSSCNEGIDTWCSSNLGVEEDYWQDAGPRSVVINDRRDPILQPEQAMLASLTARTDAAVRWFTGGKTDPDLKNDLSIIAHLSTSSHSFEVQHIRSAVDMSGLTRWRVRKQLPDQNSAFIAESRIGEASIHHDDISPQGGLRASLLSCVDEIERQCRDDFDSYIFSPDMIELAEVVDRSSYTALSSSNVDAACFFGTTDKAYLWDYELPSYARRAGENSGYYLLARETSGMVQAVRSALKLLRDSESLSDEGISLILTEISRRGMPTLKRLTTGGSMSFGEIGMLIALRTLQSEFEEKSSISGLIPVKGDDSTLNLIVSADPFQKHFDDLRTAIDFKQGERPDLLVMSILFDSGSPVRMRLTPVEVKARDGSMSQKEREEALKQASIFSLLLLKIKDKADEVELWGIAWRNLLATMLDYGFRVYGQLDQFMTTEEWAAQHSSILKAIANNDLAVEIDTSGRLIVIDNSAGDSLQDIDNDSFKETAVFSHAEAFSILARTDNSFTESVNSKLGNWGFKPKIEKIKVGDKTIGESKAEPVGEIHPDSGSGSKDNPSLGDDFKNEDNPEGDGAVTIQGVDIKDQDRPLDGVSSGINFCVGETLTQFKQEKLNFFPSNTALNQLNVGIVGDLGTGKTQLIQALVRQLTTSPDMNRGKRPNILIFDYKKDYSKENFVKATGARVISPYNIPLNLFDVRDSVDKSRAQRARSKFFIDVLDKIYSGIGPVQRQRIKSAVKSAYESKGNGEGDSPTINDVFEAYKEDSGKPDIPYNIMDDLVDDGYFVEDNSAVIPFSEFLDGVVVIDLSEIGQDDRAKNMLVVIFLNLFYEHMLRIEKKEFLGENPKLRFIDTMLLVDEADNIMKYEFDVLKKILLQGREFGVGVLLASQYLSHFKTSHENYLEPLLSWFVHKVPNVTIKELEGIGLTNVNPDVVDKIKTLECHQCLYKTLGVDGKVIRATPFFELMK